MHSTPSCDMEKYCRFILWNLHICTLWMWNMRKEIVHKWSLSHRSFSQLFLSLTNNEDKKAKRLNADEATWQILFIILNMSCLWFLFLHHCSMFLSQHTLLKRTIHTHPSKQHKWHTHPLDLGRLTRTCWNRGSVTFDGERDICASPPSL